MSPKTPFHTSSLAAAVLCSTTAFAFVGPSEFADSHAGGPQESVQSTRSPLSRKVIQVETQDVSSSLLRNQGSRTAGVQWVERRVDSVDGSTVLVRGDLGLSLAEVKLPQRWGQSHGSVWTALSSVKSEAERNRLAQAIAEALTQKIAQNPELRLEAGTLQLNAKRSFVGEAFTSLSFDLIVAGRKVHGAEMTARFREGKWVSWTSESFGAATGTAEVLATTRKVDLERMVSDFFGQSLQGRSKTQAIWMPQVRADGNGYELIPSRQVEITDTEGLVHTLTVSESTGELLEFYPHQFNYSGQITGTYYSRHPLSATQTSGMPFVSVKSGGRFRRQTHTADEDGNLSVPQADEVAITLTSPIVSVSNSGGANTQVTTAGDLYLDPEENTTYAETTVFFHTTVIHQFVEEIIGDQTPWLEKQIKANVNISNACNAFFRGNTINFFQAGTRVGRDGVERTCNNTGEIADVVYHEWGHALDANTGGIADGAFSEGIGDIVSMLITNSPEVGPHFMVDGSPVRNLDGEYQYPPGPDEREVHKEGRIIGATWYHMTQDLIAKYGMDVGRETARRWFLPSLFSASRYTQQYDVIVALDAEENGENGPNFCLINGAFARHGLAQKDASCR